MFINQQVKGGFNCPIDMGYHSLVERGKCVSLLVLHDARSENFGNFSDLEALTKHEVKNINYESPEVNILKSGSLRIKNFARK